MEDEYFVPCLIQSFLRRAGDLSLSTRTPAGARGNPALENSHASLVAPKVVVALGNCCASVLSDAFSLNSLSNSPHL